MVSDSDTDSECDEYELQQRYDLLRNTQIEGTVDYNNPYIYETNHADAAILSMAHMTSVHSREGSVASIQDIGSTNSITLYTLHMI